MYFFTELRLPLPDTFLVLFFIRISFFSLYLFFFYIFQETGDHSWWFFLIDLVDICQHYIFLILFIATDIIVSKIDIGKTNFIWVYFFNDLIWYSIDLISFECFQLSILYSFFYLLFLLPFFLFFLLLHLFQFLYRLLNILL